MENESTNEEKRVGHYHDDVPPTDPQTVNHDTALEHLNLNWRERDLPEHERTKHVHRLHSYLGKFIPQLAEIILRKYFSPGETILDPFAGSGTALVQANELGINSIGQDISAFNVLLCRVKTAEYGLKRLHDEVLDILGKVRAETQNDMSSLPLFNSEPSEIFAPQTNDEYLLRWFAPQALRELLTYLDHIDRGNYKYKDVLKIILSRSARSARLTTHFDLDFPKQPQTEPYWCYKHSRDCSPTTEAFKFLNRYSHDTLRRISAFAKLRTDASVTVRHGDSRKDYFPPIDGVITSPPYVGLIDYHEQHAYAYHLLELEDRRESEIGSASAGSSKQAKNQYQEDIARVFQKALDSMPKGGRLIVIAADKAQLYDEIAQTIAVEIEDTIYRHVNRRTGRRSSEFYESVFIWRKT